MKKSNENNKEEEPWVAVDVELRIYGHGFKSWTIGEVVV